MADKKVSSTFGPYAGAQKPSGSSSRGLIPGGRLLCFLLVSKAQELTLLMGCLRVANIHVSVCRTPPEGPGLDWVHYYVISFSSYHKALRTATEEDLRLSPMCGWGHLANQWSNGVFTQLLSVPGHLMNFSWSRAQHPLEPSIFPHGSVRGALCTRGSLASHSWAIRREVIPIAQPHPAELLPQPRVEPLFLWPDVYPAPFRLPLWAPWVGGIAASRRSVLRQQPEWVFLN